MSNEPIESDEERDIADDALLSALSVDLEAASRITDNRLLILIGVALILVLLPKFVRVPVWAVYTLAFLSGFSIIGGIAYTIWWSVQKKQSVANRNGLRCSACGPNPKVFRIMQAATLRKCPSCRSALDVHLPSGRVHG
jgi:hypothetical protein